MSPWTEFETGLCRLCGLDPDDVTSLTVFAKPGDAPIIQATMLVRDRDGSISNVDGWIEQTGRRYTLIPIDEVTP
jgi:hypothetical protein